MKRKYMRIIGLCLVTTLMVVLPVIASGCGTTTTGAAAGPTLSSLSIAPELVDFITGKNTTPALPLVLTKGDKSVNMVATGTWSDGAKMDNTAIVDWVSSNTAVVTVTNVKTPAVRQADLTAVGPGTATITASCFGITSTAFTVTVK